MCLARYVPSIASHHITWIQSSFINKNRNNKCIPWLCQQLENDRIHATFKKLEKKGGGGGGRKSRRLLVQTQQHSKRRRRRRDAGDVFSELLDPSCDPSSKPSRQNAASSLSLSLSLYSISSFSLSLSSRFFFSCCCPWL